MRSTSFILSSLLALIAFLSTFANQNTFNVLAVPVLRRGEEAVAYSLKMRIMKKREPLSLLALGLANGNDIALLGGNVNDESACATPASSGGGLLSGGLLNLSAVNGNNIALLGSTVNKVCVPSSAIGGGGNTSGAAASATASANAGNPLAGIL